MGNNCCNDAEKIQMNSSGRSIKKGSLSHSKSKSYMSSMTEQSKIMLSEKLKKRVTKNSETNSDGNQEDWLDE